MRKKNKRIVKSRPKRIRTLDGFSNPLARLGDGTPNLLNGTVYSMKRLTRDFMLLNSLYREHWIIRRIIDIIPSDMLKNWITITTAVAPDVLRKVDIELRRTQLIQKIKRGLQWGRLYGGAIGLMLIKGQGDNLSEPLSLAKMVPGDFCGLLILDRWNGVNPSLEVIDDIGSPDYGLPKYYDITDTTTDETVRVHHSRVIRFIGDDLPYWESQMEQQWGASVIESIFDDLRKRDNVSWNIAQLTFMANLRVLKMQDMGQLLSAADTQSQKELYDTIQKQNWLMSNMGIQLMDAADSMESHQYSFSGISDVYQQFMMDISGAAQIPATKLYGRSPEGMNATGESDLQNYYDMIGQEQEAKLRPILNKLLPPLCMSVFGAVPDDLDFEFDPVSEPSDQERSDLAKSGTENVVTALNAGLVSKRTALKELKQQSERTGVWTNITDEDILKASDEIEEEGEMGGFPGMEGMMGGEEEKKPPQMPPEKPPQMPKRATDSTFREEEHPRADNGEFTKVDSNKVNIEAKNKPKTTTRKRKAPKYSKSEGYEKQIGEPINGEYHGNSAIAILLEKKSGYVPNAFKRKDIGEIALPWGDDFMGLKHIIQERASQGVDLNSFLPKLTDIIETGDLNSRNGRYYISKEHYTAVVSPTYFDDKFTFLLTGWDNNVSKHEKKH